MKVEIPLFLIYHPISCGFLFFQNSSELYNKIHYRQTSTETTWFDQPSRLYFLIAFSVFSPLSNLPTSSGFLNRKLTEAIRSSALKSCYKKERKGKTSFSILNGFLYECILLQIELGAWNEQRRLLSNRCQWALLDTKTTRRTTVLIKVSKS